MIKVLVEWYPIIQEECWIVTGIVTSADGGVADILSLSS